MSDNQTEELNRANIEIKKLNRKINQLETIIERGKMTEATRQSIQNKWRTESARLDRYMTLLLDNSPNAILIFDAEKKLQFCTELFLKILHLPTFDSINNFNYIDVFSLFLNEEWLTKIENCFSLVMNEKRSVSIDELADLDAGSGPRHYSISIAPMLDANNNAEGAIAIFNDITEEKVARESAVKASTAKTDFLANMSHEMRTPMNAIIGMTNIANGTDDVDRKNYCLSKIGDAATHLLGIINDVLDMSKIEANKLELSYTDFNFEKMVMKISNVLAFSMGAKDIDFVAKIDPSIPNYIFSDEQRMAQVITNFLSNATKFTPERGSIKLNAHRVGQNTEKDISYIRISVTDTGIGIADDQLANVFASFEQADNSISRKYGGTGLGLAISKKIVELMHGTIGVESAPGKGSTFEFTIPVQRGDGPAISSLPKGTNWKNLKVLAVDDSKETREYFASTAEVLGLNCDVASGAKEALELLVDKNNKYDIIFVDCKMPDIDGIELTKIIKEENRQDIIIIMISSAEWAEIADRAKAAGVDGFIPKPLFTSSITDCINNCLDPDEEIYEEDHEEQVKAHEFDGIRILLAEDVDINREIVHGLLEGTGVIITEAENGVEVVEKFRDHPDAFDVIFMDIHMPVKDGYIATREIRDMNFPEATDIPIIAMTANVFKQDIDKCIEAGMNDHIGKPIDIEDFFTKLTTQLKRVNKI